MKKRVIAAILALTMCCACQPIMASDLNTGADGTAAVTDESTDGTDEGTGESTDGTDEGTGESTDGTDEGTGEEGEGTDEEVTKEAQTPTFSAETMYTAGKISMYAGESDSIIASDAYGTITYTSEDDSLVTVDENGLVTGIVETDDPVAIDIAVSGDDTHEAYEGQILVEISGNVSFASQLQVGDTVSVEADSENYYYTFTPDETGYYEFISEGSGDPSIFVEQTWKNFYHENDNKNTSKGWKQFDLIVQLTAGTRYYIYLADTVANGGDTMTVYRQTASVPTTGMFKSSIDNKWHYASNGTIDYTYVGLGKNQWGWWYINCGTLDLTYTGMARNQYGWWYVTKGKLDTTFTGMAWNQYGWWYMTNGKLNSTYTGFGTNAYGTWYFKNGKIQTSYTGYAKVNGKYYYIKKGKVIR